MKVKQEIVYSCKGDPTMQDEYMDFINYVFGFNGNGSDFYKLLPKLYKKEYNPCGSSYVVIDGGRIKAAIGAFDIGVEVCGEKLACRGIGNVAVHPFSRSKGYMKRLMEQALDDMVKDGVDFSVLGGRRQRYNYFSFDKGGSSYSFTVNSDNVRHCFGSDRAHRFEIRKVGKSDTETLRRIAELAAEKPYYASRDERDLFDILVSWRASIYAAFEGGSFAGYAIALDKRITESATVKPSDYTDFIVCLYDSIASGGKLEVTLPEFEQEHIKALYAMTEGWLVTSNELYSVLNYRHTCEAFMRLKATYAKLPDGELVIHIDGRAGEENLLFAVRDGVPSVMRTDREPSLKLSHLEAERLIFASVAPDRLSLPSFAQLWFPLPIWMYSADMV